ncbi:MAG: serine hydrolase [Chloracidobacterium sp.]|nr:serine hydrolase [Chloracidobacterium sp.]
MNRMRYVSILMIAAAAFVCTPDLNGQASKAKRIDELLLPLGKSGQFSGVVLASENGKVIYEKAFGMANAELKVPNAVNSRFGIASITKPMTSVILSRLIEAGKFGLEVKLTKFIPDFPNGDKITVSMLSTHRSGIPHRVMPPESETRRFTAAEFVEEVKKANLAFEPGSQRLYSSAGYAVLARVLEIASGQTYAQLLIKYVFEPAGMNDSIDWDSSILIERRVHDYLQSENGPINAPYKDYSFLVGGGSVLSTASDVHKFGIALIDGKYGEAAKRNWIQDGVMSASGSTNGRRAYVEIKDDKSYGIAVLANMASGSFDFVQRGVTEILQGKEPTVKTLTVPKFDRTANKNLEEFAGSYRRNDGGGFNIVLRDGSLFSGDIKLLSVKPNCFFDFRFYGDVCFSRDAGGKVTGINWKGLTFELAGTRQ